MKIWVYEVILMARSIWYRFCVLINIFQLLQEYLLKLIVTLLRRAGFVLNLNCQPWFKTLLQKQQNCARNSQKGKQYSANYILYLYSGLFLVILSFRKTPMTIGATSLFIACQLHQFEKRPIESMQCYFSVISAIEYLTQCWSVVICPSSDIATLAGISADTIRRCFRELHPSRHTFCPKNYASDTAIQNLSMM